MLGHLFLFFERDKEREGKRDIETHPSRALP